MPAKNMMVIFGTRPEAIKMGPVIQTLKEYPNWFNVKVVVTGQHQEQLYQVLNHFKIQPDVDLRLMEENQSLLSFSSKTISELDRLVKLENPDCILVHGDTQTSLCGALTAFFYKIPFGHVEAGLRSFNRYSPWPEEVNRKLVDVAADFLFAPTPTNRRNLVREGFKADQIFVTGQTGIDSAKRTYHKHYEFHHPLLKHLSTEQYKMVTFTAHRRENHGDHMESMFSALLQIVDTHPDVMVIYPVHLNPIVHKQAFSLLSGHPQIKLIDPIDYPDMINLLARSSLILSDSGGIQEEAAVFQTPLVLMRDTTERPEAVQNHAVYVAGPEEKGIFDRTNQLLMETPYITKSGNPFGDGYASKRIVQILANYFEFTSSLPEEFQPRLNN